MRDEVVGLEHKAHRVVAVGVHVLFGEMLGALATDEQITLGVAVQPANDVQQGGLAAAGGAQHRHKLARGEVQADAAQRLHLHLTRLVGFGNSL